MQANWPPLLLVGGLAAFTLMTAVWALGLGRKDASLVDRVWGLGFVVAMAGYLVACPELSPRSLFVFALVCLWGGRLSWHIHRRNRGHGEDPRYTAMRHRHGSAFAWKSLFIVNWLQAGLLLLISAPLLLLAAGGGQAEITIWDIAGGVVWCAGFAFEVIGDAQLKKFRANPANRGLVLNSGLWRFTRHPNYFGDALLWWGYWLFACAVPFGVATVFGPILMTFLLRRVSGVTLLEKDLIARKPGYAAYVASTPAFVPRLSKRPFRSAD